MKVFLILFTIFCFLKTIFYCKFEIEEKQNKSGGIALFIFAILGLIFTNYNILFFY